VSNIDRKELKHPDQFLTFLNRLGTFITSHRLGLISGVGAVLVICFAAWGISTFVSKRAAQTSQAFAKIERIAGADLLPATGEAPKTDDGLAHFKTEQARLEAALKEADTFLAAHGGSNLADEALLLKAKYLLMLGKSSDALAIYQGKLGAVDARLRFLAQEGLGYALEATGQTDGAIAAFAALAEQAQASGGFYRDRALYHKARLTEKKGNVKDAEKIFREILEKAPNGPLREEINDRLAALEGK
jgi:tetratricopeptide (TPR) repeat protein